LPSTTEIYTLSLHDALPISRTNAPAPRRTCLSNGQGARASRASGRPACSQASRPPSSWATLVKPSAASLEAACAERLPERQRQRSEEHTSELQSRGHLVCRL